MRICITTDRLPQPERQRGCILEIDEERGLSLIGQGFAVAIEDTAPAPAAPPEPLPEPLPEPRPEPLPEPAAAPAPRRIRTSAR